MKKINNKGFLLVETLVVATFTMTVLVILFLQFKNLIINYNNSFKYNTVEGIYSLNSIKKYLNEFSTELEIKDNYIVIVNTTDIEIKCPMEENDFCPPFISAGNFKTVYYAKEGIKDEEEKISQGMKNFIKQLDFGDDSRLIAEYENGTFASIKYQNPN